MVDQQFSPVRKPAAKALALAQMSALARLGLVLPAILAIWIVLWRLVQP